MTDLQDRLTASRQDQAAERGSVATAYPGWPTGTPVSRPSPAQAWGHEPPAPTAAPSMVQSVNVSVGGPTVVVATRNSGPSLVVRALWYLCVGWWLSAIVIVVGYLLMFTIVGIPAAFALFNKIPQALTLRPRTQRWQTAVVDGVTVVSEEHQQQLAWYVRLPYFVFVGFWLGALWLTVAWVIGLLVLPLPLSFMMYNRVGGVMTLHRH